LTTETTKKLAQDFHTKHQSLNGYNMPSTPLEIVNLRVVAKGITDKPHKKIKLPSPNTNSSDKALTGHRKAFFGEKFKDTPVYDGLQLSSGSTVLGPALLEQETTTVIVQPNFQLTCDELGNYLVYHKKQSLKKTFSVLTKKGSSES
jgi:N-methylhydantoinase A